MAASDPTDAISQLRAATSPSEQLSALKHLKNQIIGHPLRKERLVRRGLIHILVQLLGSILNLRGSTDGQSANGSGSDPTTHAAVSNVSDDVHLQALTLLGSLAHGGPSILKPLVHASVEDLLIASISPTHHAPKVTSAALKASLNFLEAYEYASGSIAAPLSPRLEKWNQPATARAYRAILSPTISSPLLRSQISLVCQLISKTVHNDDAQDMFCNAGVLDCVAAHLASHYVHNHPRSSKSFGSIVASLPPPPSSKYLPDVLGAASALVEGSRHRVASLLLSPPLVPIMRWHNSQVALESRLHHPSVYALYDTHPRSLAVPWIHYGVQKPDSNFTKAFPPLGTSQASTKNPAFIDFADSEKTHLGNSPGVDSAMTPWLIHLMRSDKGLTRVRAARLLARIAHAEYMSRAKSHTLALLVIPLLLELLKSSDPISMSQLADPLGNESSRALSEVPYALGALLEESSIVSPSVLKGALEAGIVKELCQYLKKTFEAIENRAPLWSENADASAMDEDDDPTRALGERGISDKVIYLFDCRRAGLSLLSSIAGNRPGEDKYRKALVENGVITSLVDSLTPFNAGSVTALQSQGGRQKLDASIGNPVDVLIAACIASTAMARSIYLLRTSLIDAGLAKPVFRLVQHPNVDVQVAALAVMCNMLVDCSPMRQGIIDDGVIEALCERAHSADPRVQANALWATKHLVSQAPSEIKQACIERLGVSWLLSVIEGQNVATPADAAHSFVSSNSSINAGSNAMGERVSIFHTPDDDEQMHDSASQDPEAFTANGAEGKEKVPRSAKQDHDNLTDFGRPVEPQHQTYLAAVKASEDENKAQMPQRESNAIQAHALDILRNVICGPGESTMIDFVMGTIGHAKLYSILESKLRTSIDGFQTVNDLPIKTLDAALKTICHLAAGPSRYRADLIAQRNIFDLLIPMFHHHDPEIRSTCCWILTNLMWVDDGTDMYNAKQRALTLKQIGFDALLDDLTKKPSDGGREHVQDVRERANAAKDCMSAAVTGRSARVAEPTGLGHGVGLRTPGLAPGM